MPDGMISHRFVGHAIPYISFVTPEVGMTEEHYVEEYLVFLLKMELFYVS